MSPSLQNCKESRVVPLCQEAAEKIKGANTGKVLVGFREVGCFLLLLLLSLCLESGRGPRMVPTPLRRRAGASSWRLAEDPVKEQAFRRHGEASDLDKQPAGCGSVLGKNAAL